MERKSLAYLEWKTGNQYKMQQDFHTQDLYKLMQSNRICQLGAQKQDGYCQLFPCQLSMQFTSGKLSKGINNGISRFIELIKIQCWYYMNTLLPPTSLVGKPIIYFTIIETYGLFKISKLTIRFENFLILYRHTSIWRQKDDPNIRVPSLSLS